MLRIRQLMVLLVALLSIPVWAATYQLDPGQTFPRFEIDHLWLFTERGQFARTHGTLEFDVERHTGSLEVVIDASSLDTGNDERDAVLKGAGWFDVSRYPTITFRSQRFLFEQDRLAAIEGELTMLGVAQPMRLEIAWIKCGLNPASRKWRCGADASGTLQRSRFGMRTGLPFVGDEVRLRIQARTYP
ncbi:MAG: YceI [Proteobacteria bacterium]|nr:YceI [Pseudomonadota bacterium]MBS1218739.1 YceI [Pseudomonadota bacterium]